MMQQPRSWLSALPFDDPAELAFDLDDLKLDAQSDADSACCSSTWRHGSNWGGFTPRRR